MFLASENSVAKTNASCGYFLCTVPRAIDRHLSPKAIQLWTIRTAAARQPLSFQKNWEDKNCGSD